MFKFNPDPKRENEVLHGSELGFEQSQAAKLKSPFKKS